MANVTIWHNPRCSKSRQTLELLRERGIEPTIVEYLKTPPTEAELTHALADLGMKPRDLIRKREAAYRELGLDDESLSEAELVSAMAKHPVLIERPVVFVGRRAAIGRPPDSVLELFA
jgi:arsenate reductase